MNENSNLIHSFINDTRSRILIRSMTETECQCIVQRIAFSAIVRNKIDRDGSDRKQIKEEHFYTLIIQAEHFQHLSCAMVLRVCAQQRRTAGRLTRTLFTKRTERDLPDD